MSAAFNSTYPVQTLLNASLDRSIDAQDHDKRAALEHILSSPLYPYVVIPRGVSLPENTVSKHIITLEDAQLQDFLPELELMSTEIPYYYSGVLLDEWATKAEKLYTFLYSHLIESGQISDTDKEILKKGY